ncbi:MAG TPA: BrnT family toxin [Terracidiphilus sp.]|nr:BrnT family toxin [Terracidiphilus sp.]
MEHGTEDRDNIDDLKFEWHPSKASSNLKKHKVSFGEAKAVFGDKRHIVVPDRVHSYNEERSLAIGVSEKRRLLTMCFTERRDRIRIISARLAEPWERRIYEGSDWKE